MRARRLAAGLTVAAILGGCGSGSPRAEAPITVNVVLSQPAQTASTRSSITQPGAPSPQHATTTGSGTHITVTIPAATPAPSVSASAGSAVTTIDGRLRGVAVWLPYWGAGAALATATEHASEVNVAHPFWFEITGDATVVNQVGSSQAAMVSELRSAGEEVIPTVTETADEDQFAHILATPSQRAALISALEYIADQSGVSGVDLDFENLAVGDGNVMAADTVAHEYPEMFAQLCSALHASGRVCEVTVVARTGAVAPSASAFDSGVYDYAALAAAADRVQVMAYDDHVPSGAAGPIAPMSWVEDVVAYASTQVPVAKLVLGIPAYGYDWASKGPNTSLTATAAEQLAESEHAKVIWDPAADEPTFTYTVGKIRHTVWYEDAEAGYLRAALADQDGLAGVALWAAGDEDPQLWPDLAKLR